MPSRGDGPAFLKKAAGELVAWSKGHSALGRCMIYTREEASSSHESLCLSMNERCVRLGAMISSNCRIIFGNEKVP